MLKGQFYNFTTTDGVKMVNINNIAAIESFTSGTRVTLNVKDKQGDFLSFVADQSWGQATAEIKIMDENQKRQ